MEIEITQPGGAHLVDRAGVEIDVEPGFARVPERKWQWWSWRKDVIEPEPEPHGQVRVGRFDEIEHALDVEFIKMDVEGFEPQVWTGMTKILEQRRPLTIFMEFTVGRLPDPAGFLEQILSYGFSLELISFDCGIIPVSREAILNGPRDVDHMLVFRR